MTNQTHRILIGSLGWQHEGWQDAYYPEELPPEWRLGYYSNEFPLAVITQTERADEDALLEEIDDCREDLVVLQLVELAQADDPALAAACRLAEKLPRQGGLLLRVDPALINDSSAWLQRVRELTGSQPLCLSPASPLDANWRAALQAQHIGWCWNAHAEGDGLAIGPLAVIEVGPQASPRELRDVIAAGLAAGSTQRLVALVFCGEPPVIESMRQARTLEELM